jgi:hypothetical protein
VAEELRQYNIRLSIVSPGSIKTDFNDHSGQGAASGKDPKKKLQPDDIASVVAMLVTHAHSASSAKSWCARPRNPERQDPTLSLAPGWLSQGSIVFLVSEPDEGGWLLGSMDWRRNEAHQGHELLSLGGAGIVRIHAAQVPFHHVNPPDGGGQLPIICRNSTTRPR